MVADRNIQLGCAILKVIENRMYKYFTACNYAFTNMINQPVYIFGPPASKCASGKNPDYPGLCSVNEKYNVNLN